MFHMRNYSKRVEWNGGSNEFTYAKMTQISHFFVLLKAVGQELNSIQTYSVTSILEVTLNKINSMFVYRQVCKLHQLMGPLLRVYNIRAKWKVAQTITNFKMRFFQWLKF